MKTSNPISSVKKLRIGGFIFRVFNSHGNILYFVFMPIFFIFCANVKVFCNFIFFPVFLIPRGIYMLCFHVDVDFIVEI